MQFFLPITCTDRGQHRRIILTTARRELDGTGGMNYALLHFSPPMQDASPGEQISRESYRFECPLCRRAPMIKARTWWRVVDEMVAAGQSEIDLSLLPF